MTNDIVVGRTKKDRERFGLDGTIFLGKHYVTMGHTVALSNKIFLDMIRSHVVFVCGKRGSGKCLTGSTKITIDTGEVVTIQELEKRNDGILSLGQDLKMTAKKWEGFYKRNVASILKVTLRTGKEIALTPEHPVLTVDGWKPVQELPVGARIATPRVQPVFGESALPEHEVKLIAYLLAEGHIKGKYVLFSNYDQEIVNDFTQSVHAFNAELRVVMHSTPGCYSIRGRTPKTRSVTIKRDKQGQFAKGSKIDRRSDVRLWLDKHGMHGKLAKERTMPACIFTLPKHQLAVFLNRLFSCDGCIYEKTKSWWQISYSSASKEFIHAVAHLLARFGIVGRIRKKKSKEFGTHNYELEVNGEFVNTFLQEIGFFGKKERRAKKALKDSIKIVRNPNTDTIPQEIWNSYTPENWAAVGRKIGYKHPKALRESVRYSPSRQKLLQIAIADESEAMQLLATSDIFWDEIIAIEKQEGTCTVYDITVPETHNFVANDIIVHNSYTLGTITEGMAALPEHIKKNLSIILLDTMGIYWTMKYPNMKEKELLDAWELEPRKEDITIFTPVGMYDKAREEGIPTDRSFAIKPSELLGNDWITTFGLDPTSAPAVLLERIVHTLQEQNVEYSITDLIKLVEKDKDTDKVARAVVKNHLINAQNWGIFDAEGTPLAELAKAGQVTVLDLSAYATQENGWAIKSLVTGLVSQKLFIERMEARKEEEFKQVYRDVNFLSEDETLEQEMPLVWLVLDEAHEFLPNQGKTLATDPLVTILREGRQPGISLILASQQPGKIHTDVMTQSDVIISHRITAKLDTDALGLLMQSYMRSGLDQLLDGLPRMSGAALILDDNNEKMFPIQIRPRFTWHGGESPTALKKEKELF